MPYARLNSFCNRPRRALGDLTTTIFIRHPPYKKIPPRVDRTIPVYAGRRKRFYIIFAPSP